MDEEAAIIGREETYRARRLRQSNSLDMAPLRSANLVELNRVGRVHPEPEPQLEEVALEEIEQPKCWYCAMGTIFLLDFAVYFFSMMLLLFTVNVCW